MAQEFDVVLVSSSPLMLVEALRLHQDGKSVAIIDERPTMGGAWYTRDLNEWGTVEVGCHYIANNRETYHFLEEVLSLKLKDMNPQPFIWLKGIEVPHKGFQHIPNNYFRLRSAKNEKDYVRLTKEIARLFPALADSIYRQLFNRQDYRYPVDGCGVIVQRLESLVREQNIAVLLETCVERIDVRADMRGGICFTNNDPIHFKQLIINSSTRLPDLRLGEERIEVMQDYRIVQHLIVHIEGEKQRDFTYMGLYGGGILNRVSDVGIYSPNNDAMYAKNQLLLSVRVSSNSLKMTDDDRALAVIDRLITAGFIKPTAHLLDYYIDQFDYTDTSDDELAMLENRFAPAIKALRSREFGDSLKEYTRAYADKTPGV